MSDESPSTEELERRVHELASKVEQDPDSLTDEEWAFLQEMADRDDISEVEEVGDE